MKMMMKLKVKIFLRYMEILASNYRGEECSYESQSDDDCETKDQVHVMLLQLICKSCVISIT